MRMYVLVDKEMPFKASKRKMLSYHHVQGSHVVAQYAIEYSYTTTYNWRNKTLIVLGVSKRQLRKYAKKLYKEAIKFSLFCEPDLDDYITALATVVNDDQAKMFKRLELL